MPIDLHRAIAALLRPRHWSALGPAKPRSGVPAAVGVALWGVEAEADALPPAVLRTVEPGWAAWDGLPGYPVSLYLAQPWQAYLAGAGSPRPGGGASEYLIGAPTIGASTCSPGQARLIWPAGPAGPGVAYPPTLGAEGEYPSSHFGAALPSDDPTMYSGLAQLLVQSLLAAGRTVADLLPSGWSTATGTWGLVRAPVADLEPGDLIAWWLIRITSGGTFGAPLVIPAAYSCMHADLSAGTYSGTDLLRVESILLGAATVGAVAALADEATMDAAYLGRSPVHARTGWDGTDQRLGSAAEDDARYCCALWDGGPLTADGGLSHIGLLQIGWSAGVPVVTPSATGEEAWALGGESSARLYFETSPGSAERAKPPSGAAASGAAGVVYVHWGAANALCIWHYDGLASALEDGTSIPLGWDTLCGADSASASAASGVVTSRRGFARPGQSVPRMAVGGVNLTMTIAAAIGDSVSAETGYGPTSWYEVPGQPESYRHLLADSLQSCDGGDHFAGPISLPEGPPYVWPGPKTTDYLGAIDHVYTKQVVSSGSYASVLILGYRPRTVTWLAGRTYTHGSGSVIGTMHADYTGQSAPILRVDVAGQAANHKLKGTQWIGSTWASYEVQSGEETETSGGLYVGGEAVWESEDAADWAGLDGDSISTPGAVLASYGGEAIRVVLGAATGPVGLSVVAVGSDHVIPCGAV